MNLFKKMSLVVVMSVGCLSLSTEATDKNLQNMANIFRVMGQSLGVELEHIDNALGGDTDPELRRVDPDKLQKLMAANLPSLKMKFADAFNKLTQEQRDVVLSALRKWQKMSSFTEDELLSMGMGALRKRKAFNTEFEKHFPNRPLPHERTDEWLIDFANKLEKIDFGSSEFNLLSRFICSCTYINCDQRLRSLNDRGQNSLLQDALGDDKQALVINKICKQIIDPAALIFVVVNDRYFFSGWKQEFKRFGKLFAIAHDVCTQLLSVVE